MPALQMNDDSPKQLPVIPERMGSWLGDFLFPQPAERRTGAILRWWEARRLPYNVIVGTSGVAALSVMAVSSVLPPHPMPFTIPLAAIVAYGLLANVCYSLGSVVEIVCHKLWGSELLPLGPSLFRAGLTLSFGLTFVIPVILSAVWWVLRSVLG